MVQNLYTMFSEKGTDNKIQRKVEDLPRSEKIEDSYNIKASKKTFKEGEMNQWEGPYKIIKSLIYVIYPNQKTPRSKPKVVHTTGSHPSGVLFQNNRLFGTISPKERALLRRIKKAYSRIKCRTFVNNVEKSENNKRLRKA
ncbi:hypothetical protein LAZ67_20001357 [Cordylochernes scorpioides]|uniref:Uncharacterized protein n=1 Tax=Cordylochernes scorpioides TaxID=51811 RepID=A0ABY6LJW1_9ARAC|nr:hypothetical protein LAZ67_20001357 [Cordylochernes scorpioides]